MKFTKITKQLIAIVIALCLLVAELFLVGYLDSHVDNSDNAQLNLTMNPTEPHKSHSEPSLMNPTKVTTTEYTEPFVATQEPADQAPIRYTASIGAMGDLLMHRPIFNNSPVKQSDGTYNFESIFQYISDNIGSLDYAAANLETTLCGNDNGYAYNGHPHFNCPDELVDAVKDSGFDMLLTANNHSYDTGIVGYKRTIDVVRGKGLETLGTYSSSDETKWTIIDVNGIKVGMLCYTWASSVTYDGRPSLNGNSYFPEVGLCNYFHSQNLDAFYKELNEHMSEMNEAGADATIMFIHWGTEYKTSPNNEQKRIAQKLCDIGIDVIIGSHPHVVQPIELIESSVDPEHKTICLYSTGNAVSNQRQGSLDAISTAHTEDGILFSVTFEKVNGDTYVKDVDALPTWVYMDKTGGKREYNILPLEISQVERWKDAFGLDDSNFKKAQNSYERTMEIVGEGLESVRKWLKEQYGADNR